MSEIPLGLEGANQSGREVECLSALEVVNPLAQAVGSQLDPAVGCQLDPVVVNPSVLEEVNPLAQGVANLSDLGEADHSTTQEV